MGRAVVQRPKEELERKIATAKRIGLKVVVKTNKEGFDYLVMTRSSKSKNVPSTHNLTNRDI
jgi:hypothetical protein